MIDSSLHMALSQENLGYTGTSSSRFFPFLDRLLTEQMNRFALTDEDTSEYKTFESMASLVSDHGKRKVMLCTFHAL